jgi:hypothetical protein
MVRDNFFRSLSFSNHFLPGTTSEERGAGANDASSGSARIPAGDRLVKLQFVADTFV